MKKNYATLLTRIFILSFALLCQILFVVIAVLNFNSNFGLFYFITLIIGLVLANLIVNTNSNPSYKIAWIIPLLAIPMFGVVLYFFFGKDSIGSRRMQRLAVIDSKVKQISNDGNAPEISDEEPNVFSQSKYLTNIAGCPPYKNTYTEYFTIGEDMYARMLEEFEKAEKFIFIEYFIIGISSMWSGILEILQRKVKEGVDVRVIYDDVGSLTKLPPHYDRTLKQMGIKCEVFNPIIPTLTVSLNNRNHRKIVVIDGNTAFTGGVNISDEYINANQRRKHHWKDTGIMLKGDAVWSFTVMFLSMWDFWSKKNDDFSKYKPTVTYPDVTGYVQPYNDTPIDQEGVGETVYINLLTGANDYAYIFTPYLIIDNEMVTLLRTAAKRGVDVRIVTPGIGDKAVVHAMTRSFYQYLIEGGVKIYEYVPGFIHAKSCVCDDKCAAIGSINFDYRSLYLQFECATWLCKTDTVLKMKEDFLDTLEKCREITLEDCKKVSPLLKLLRFFVRAYAPLL